MAHDELTLARAEAEFAALYAGTNRALPTAAWNHRAQTWQRERERSRKNDERVDSAMAWLEGRGLLQPEFSVADIGCGPGRFAAAFARRVKQVLGLDISEKMVEHGRSYLAAEALTNARLEVCNFQTLDIEQAGLVRAFDLVFCSMTPAVRGLAELEKSMEMSRKWCCQITHLSGRNYLREQVLSQVFGIAPKPRWSSRSFFALFNLLFLRGYSPETSYDTIHRELQVDADETYAEFLMEHMLPAEAATAEARRKILAWLEAHADANGKLCEVTDTTYGHILWDVTNRSERSL